MCWWFKNRLDSIDIAIDGGRYHGLNKCGAKIGRVIGRHSTTTCMSVDAMGNILRMHPEQNEKYRNRCGERRFIVEVLVSNPQICIHFDNGLGPSIPHAIG